MPEIILRPLEKTPEVSSEILPDTLEQKISKSALEKGPLPISLPNAAKALPVQSPVILAEPLVMQKSVERVLEEGMEPLFLQLSDRDKVKFKALGESTAVKITSLLQQVKVHLGQILGLIKQWLSTISGISKYYVEQEAKIKAEKLLKLRQEK